MPPMSPAKSSPWTAGAASTSEAMSTQPIRILPPTQKDTRKPHAGADPRREKVEANKLAKRLRRLVGDAIVDYGMIGEGDRVMVCLSGGKDSYGMLDVLMSLQAKAPV